MLRRPHHEFMCSKLFNRVPAIVFIFSEICRLGKGFSLQTKCCSQGCEGWGKRTPLPLLLTNFHVLYFFVQAVNYFLCPPRTIEFHLHLLKLSYYVLFFLMQHYKNERLACRATGSTFATSGGHLFVQTHDTKQDTEIFPLEQERTTRLSVERASGGFSAMGNFSNANNVRSGRYARRCHTSFPA